MNVATKFPLQSVSVWELTPSETGWVTYEQNATVKLESRKY